MKVQPRTEEELSQFELAPDGDYPFTVLESNEIASKSEKNRGKMMFAVKLNVHGKDGDHHIYDYFADWFSEWKLRHFAATTGLIANYEAGNMDGSNGAFAGKVGYVKIATEPATAKFGAKNVVKDYIVRTTKPVSESGKPEDDDSVPF